MAVSSKVYSDGHDRLAVMLNWRQAHSRRWHCIPMHSPGNDLWLAEFTPTELGPHLFSIEAWIDPFATYCHDLEKKYHAGVEVRLELEEGRLMLGKGIELCNGALREELQALQQRLPTLNADDQVALFLDPATARLMSDAEHRSYLARSREFPVDVDRPAAQFASWYELFPRSITDSPERHGTFNDVHERLPMIRDMGFDVLYFPPIHPIGMQHRKGRNNALTAEPGDPGSPYAIGSAEGGHEAIHPQLGSRDDFRRLVAAAAEHGLEIALDFAIQCSQDHPWLKEHPGWFSWRPDGTIRYAENPPKKYQDIVNVDFYAPEAVPSLWLALRDVVVGWVEEGENLPRRQPAHQATAVLAMADRQCAQPAPRGHLPRRSLHQAGDDGPPGKGRVRAELYLLHLAQPQTGTARVLRAAQPAAMEPVLPAQLLRQHPRHQPVLPAHLRPCRLPHPRGAGLMGSGLWGMYSGFELCEGTPLPGKEEYLDSEKYEIRPRDFSQPGNIIAEIAQLNRIRRQNRALQTHLGVAFFNCWNDNILYFAKRTPERDNYILVAISLDPHNAQEAHFELPLWELGLDDNAETLGEDLMNGHRWSWYGKTQWMRIEPWHLPFGIWRIEKAR